jgi:hypothetical protein
MRTLTSPEEYRQFRTEDCHHSENVAKIANISSSKKYIHLSFRFLLLQILNLFQTRHPLKPIPKHIFYFYNFQESTFSLGVAHLAAVSENLRRKG